MIAVIPLRTNKHKLRFLRNSDLDRFAILNTPKKFSDQCRMQ